MGQHLPGLELCLCPPGASERLAEKGVASLGFPFGRDLGSSSHSWLSSQGLVWAGERERERERDPCRFLLPAGYGIGLLATFAALAWMRKGQPALLYLVPCTLLTSLLVALWRRELATFWTGSGFAVNTSLI